MSRAFVSEDAASASAALLPERPVTPGPNPVTPRGLALIDAEIARLQHLLTTTPAEDPARAPAQRDLRYWRARRLSAEVVPPVDAMQDEVVFGCRVTLRRRGAPDVSYRIVGEDEADPPQGLLSWSSPLAEAVLGAGVGDIVDPGAGRPAVTVVSLASG